MCEGDYDSWFYSDFVREMLGIECVFGKYIQRRGGLGEGSGLMEVV